MDQFTDIAHACSIEGMADVVFMTPESCPITTPESCPASILSEPSDDQTKPQGDTDAVPEWNPWLYSSAARMQGIVGEVISQALLAETIIPSLRRKRARRATDLNVFKGAVESLTCNASREHLRGAGEVRLSLDKRVLGKGGRYVSPLYSMQLPHILKLMSETGFLRITPAVAPSFNPFTGKIVPGRQTRFCAGPKLINRLDGVTLDDFDRHPGQEVVLLKSARDDRTGLADLMEYEDTADTLGYRVEVQKINSYLKDASIDYAGPTPGVDEHDRFLVRRFTRGAWGCGGRLWGGFWQKLRKADRLTNVRIDGHRAASIDLSSAVLQFAYAYVGQQAPDGDLYATINFTDTSGAPRVIPREIVKKIVASRLNGAREWPEELREHRRGLPWARVVAGLKAAHPVLADLFDRDVGQELAFSESEVLVEALLRLQQEGIVALPVHDCIVVAEPLADMAAALYLEAFHFQVHQRGRVSIERAPQE